MLPLVMVRPGLPFVVELRPAGNGKGAGMACTEARTATAIAPEKILPNIMVRVDSKVEMVGGLMCWSSGTRMLNLRPHLQRALYISELIVTQRLSVELPSLAHTRHQHP